MNNINTGGPEFPVWELNGHGTQEMTEFGMTLRDYFIAHAPAEPQPWFHPVMPPPPKERAKRPNDLTKEESEELDGWGEFIDTDEMKMPRAIAIAKDWDRYEKEYKSWRAEQKKQSYVQWPAAWADEMLKAREPKP